MKRAASIYLLLVALAALQVAYYYPRLPNVVASHFNEKGVADDWMSRKAFAACSLGTIVFVAALLLGIDVLQRRIPVSWMNMPHKDYWLAPERREETYRTLSTFMVWFGCAVLLTIIGVFQLALEANLRADKRLSNQMWILLGGYLVFTLLWAVQFYRRFKSLPSQPGSP